MPRKWVEQANSKKIDNEKESDSQIGPDCIEGYGFQFWRCRHDASCADGAGGKFIVVMPNQDAVIAPSTRTPATCKEN